jgi:regulator of sirC expression with transglutaminase-like and TPR domain
MAGANSHNNFLIDHSPLTTHHFGYNGGMDVNATLNLLAGDPRAAVDVAEIALYLARDEYPELDVEAYLSELAGMAHEAARYLRGDLSARVSGLCRYLFHEMGFRGNVQRYYDARNSYLNQVLERRTGIPITLSAVALAVGTRAGLEIHGVGLPGHFVVKAVEKTREVIFDPFHGGRILSPQQCETLIEQVTGKPFKITPALLDPIPLRFMIQRMLANLKAVYLRENDYPRAIRVIERIRQLNPSDPVQRRDLGICFLQTGRPGLAIDHFAAYLAKAPEDGQAEVRSLLERAKAEVAQWN